MVNGLEGNLIIMPDEEFLVLLIDEICIMLLTLFGIFFFHTVIDCKNVWS